MQSILRIRFLIAAGLMVILSGCSVSPAVDAVSWGVDGVSFIITGKSMTDHALSAASGQDCAMMRVAKGQNACVPRDEDIAGDRMVFALDDSPWTESRTAMLEEGDPLAVDAAAAMLVEPLGPAVRVENRSTAISAVQADRPLVGSSAVHGVNLPESTAGSALVKAKPVSQAASLGEATRLWLPVEAAD